MWTGSVIFSQSGQSLKIGSPEIKKRSHKKRRFLETIDWWPEKSLKKFDAAAAPGETPQFSGVYEQRLTGFLIFLLIGL